jgi:hypothetical protein
MSDFARIYTTGDPNEAEIIKNALEAAGIECFTEGEQQAGFAGVFDINLVVPQDKADAARQILSEVHSDKEE